MSIVDEDVVLNQILKNSKGDLRRAITLLQSASKISSVTKETISSELINELTGKVSVEKIQEFYNVMKTKNIKSITTFVNEEFLQKGYSCEIVIQQLHEFIYLDTTNNVFLKEDDDVAHWLFFETDCKLVNGGNEYIQLMNFALKLSKCL